jgi:hypothetical protein
MFKRQSQEEKDTKQYIKEIDAVLNCLPFEQLKAVKIALVNGRVSVLEHTEIVQKNFKAKEKTIYSVEESTTEKNDTTEENPFFAKMQKKMDLESKIENFNQLGKEAKKSMVVTMVKNASGNYNLTTGDIDGMIETINSMNPKPKCVKISTMPFGERAGKLTLFINVNKKVDRKGTPLNKKHALNLFKELGYEVVLK